jgi:hypothetical protein
MKTFRFLLPIDDGGRSDRPFWMFGHYETLWIRIAERLEEYGINDTEHRAVCSDSQSEGQHRDSREARMVQHHPTRQTQVTPKIGHTSLGRIGRPAVSPYFFDFAEARGPESR